MRSLLPLAVLAALALPLEEAVAGAFTLDPVLVADMRAMDGLSKGRAAELEQVLADRLNQQFLMVGVDELPDYESYTAVDYVESCPVTQLDGCAFIIGERGEALWVLIGTVEDNGDGHDVSVTFVDVEATRALITVENQLRPGDEESWAEAMAGVLNLVVDGAANDSDIRPGDEQWEGAWERRRAEAERVAGELGEAGGLDTMVRIPTATAVKKPKVKTEDLDEYAETDATTPWERVDMSQGEFLKYRNSGMSLEDWKTKQLGRFGKIIARASVGGGSGAYSQYYDGRWARDSETLSVVHVESFQQVTSSGSTQGELELGFGVLPFMDITGYIGFRTGQFEYYQHQETVGDPTIEGVPESHSMSTNHYGGRVTFAPMPYSKVRPIGMVGVFVWSGKNVSQIVGLPAPLQADVHPSPALTFIEFAPGLEFEAHKLVSVFGRIGGTMPLAGKRLWESTVGEGLETFGTKRPNAGFGFTGVVGVQFNYGLIKPKFEAQSDFDDEPPEDFDDEPPEDGEFGDILDLD